MKGRTLIFTLLCAAVALAALLLLAGEASAQCALCKAAASAAGRRAAEALNTGIIVLLVPPVSIFCGLFFVAYRYRRPRGEENVDGHEGSDV